jgi:hypothetical protein
MNVMDEDLIESTERFKEIFMEYIVEMVEPNV